MKALLTTLSLGITTLGFSQLTITTGLDMGTLQNMLGGSGVAISNVTFAGDPSAIGSFSGASEIPISHGLVLSSGAVQDLAGPAGNSAGASLGEPGYTPLSNATGTPDAMGYDAAVLEFDVIPNGDSLWFNFAFGSEEYPEYVGSAFNDVFAIFISGPGIAGVMNIARLSDGSVVSINTVNNGSNNSGPCANCADYIDNINGLYVSLDAFTSNILVGTGLQAGQAYHITFAIEDVMDGILDSGVFIEAYSFKSNGALTISETDKLGVQLMPNPANNQVTLDFESTFADVTITDVDGSTVLSRNGIASHTTLDISELPAGVYFVELISDGMSVIKQLVKR